MDDKEKLLKNLNDEMDKVSTLMGWLIHQPDLATSITQIDKKKIMNFNLIRLKCAEIWAKKMQEQFKDKLDEKDINIINELFEKHINIDYK